MIRERTPDRARLAALLEMRQLATDVEWWAKCAYLHALRGNDAECAAAWAKGLERLERLWAKAQAEQGSTSAGEG